MGRFSDIKEVLWVSAPVLILFTLLINSSTASSCLTPFSLEVLFDGVRKLDKFDLLGGEAPQEERSLLFLLILRSLSVRNDHVMNRLLFVLWMEHTSLSYLTLPESLQPFCGFEDDVAFAYFPQSVSLGFDPDYNEVNRNVRSLGDLLVLLHQTYY